MVDGWLEGGTLPDMLGYCLRCCRDSSSGYYERPLMQAGRALYLKVS